MEDPDAKPVTPFVHWVMWNIPANITSVPEGVQEQARLSDPDGVLQGLTTRGAPGYYGPKPPVGEAARGCGEVRVECYSSRQRVFGARETEGRAMGNVVVAAEKS